jgi:cyclase
MLQRAKRAWTGGLRMSRFWTRRKALGAAVAAAGVALAPRLAGAARAPRLALDLLPLADDLFLVTGASANLVVARSAEGLLLVDGGPDAAAAPLSRLLKDRFAGAPVRTLFNTHWHWDQTGYNAAARKQGADIIAHENTRLWLGADVDCTWEGRRYPPRPVATRPNQTFFAGSKKLVFGGQELQYGYLPQAHTDGDLYVYFPREDVLVAGDVVAGRRYPLVDPCSNGWLGGMAQGLKDLAGRIGADTRIVAGQGPVLGPADVAAQRDLCFEVLSRIGQSYYRGESRAEFLASRPTREFDATFGDPALFLATAYDGAWNHVTEIRRVVR